MKILSFTVGPFAENTYLLVNEGKALLVDPGFSSQSEYAAFQKALSEENAELTGIVLTHAHVDHVLGLNQVIRSHDIPVWLNHRDLFLWENIESQATLFGLRVPGFSFTPEPLAEQQGFMAGPFPMDVLYTPGHSPDHVSLYLPGEKAIIAGDVLFRESVGRTDLYKGDSELLSSTIRNKLYTLPDETTIYPGHGPATTIGHEKRHNPFTVAPSA